MPPPTRGPLRRLWLVRHGQTTWNAEGRWQGSLDVELSEIGREQARALGRRLAGVAFTAAHCSSLGRARETAVLATNGRLVPREEPRLCELSYGSWEGVRDEDLGLSAPAEREAWWTTPHAVRPGGGESLDELSERAWTGLQACLGDAEGDVLVVAHGGVNRVLLARLLDAPLSRFWSFDQAPTAVNLVELPAGPPEEALRRARVLLLNCTRHLLP